MNGQTIRVAAKNCAHCNATFERDKRNTWAYWEKAKYCSQACAGFAQTALANASRASVEVEFARWFTQGDGCWEWQGARDRNGYGAFSYACVTRRAHVVALELDGRPAGRGQHACHTCDNPACVRPSHLYPGTPQQNVDDAVARRRHQHGERHYAAKLTPDAVRIIRASNLASPALAAQFGVTRTAIDMARSGRTWKSVA